MRLSELREQMRAPKMPGTDERMQGLRDAITAGERAARERPDDHAVLLDLAVALIGLSRYSERADAGTLLARACEALDRADPLAPGDAPVLYTRALARQALSDHRPRAEREFLLRQVCADYRRVAELDGESAESLQELADALYAPAYVLAPAEAEGLYREACTCCERATRLDPDHYNSWLTWGHALQAMAGDANGDDAASLVGDAIAKFERAALALPGSFAPRFWRAYALRVLAQHQPEAQARRTLRRACADLGQLASSYSPYAPTMGALGGALVDLARLEKHRRAKRYRLLEACEWLERVARLSPADLDVLRYQSTATKLLIDISPPREEAEVLRAVRDRCRQITEADPECAEAWSLWGNTLLAEAKRSTSARSMAAREEGRARLLRAEQIEPGAGAYDLACLALMEAKAGDCPHWLEVAVEYGTLPSREHVTQDPDLASVRDEAWFQEFVARAYPDRGE